MAYDHMNNVVVMFNHRVVAWSYTPGLKDENKQEEKKINIQIEKKSLVLLLLLLLLINFIFFIFFFWLGGM
jgi:hypothetical protein